MKSMTCRTVATAVMAAVSLFVSLSRAQTSKPSTAPTTATAPARPPVRVLLMGDSTVRGTYPRMVAPWADPLEKVVEKLLATEGDLPPVEVINLGVDGDTVQGLFESKRYERDVQSQKSVDFIFTRYGINDARKPDWQDAFPKAYHELLTRLRADFPNATVTIETVIPYKGGDLITKTNEVIKRIAADEKVPLLDENEPFSKELAIQGPNALTYRYVALDSIPEKLRPLIPEPFKVSGGKFVCVIDNTLDAQFREVPRWFADRHPNPAGFQVIGKTIATYLAPKIRERVPK